MDALTRLAVFAIGTLAWVAADARSSLEVGPTVTISTDDPGTPLAESWFAVNPRDPNNMIATSMAFSKQGPWASAMYSTTDAGVNWHRVVHGPQREAYFWGADPVVVFGSDGTAYYSDLEAGSLGETPFDEDLRSYGIHANVFMYRSTDGGKSWSNPLALYGDDHTCIAVDESHGKYRGRVYATYTSTQHNTQGTKTASTIGFAYSDDDGVTYRQRVFSSPDTQGDTIADGPSPTDLIVTWDGTLVLAYVDFQTSEPGAPHEHVTQRTWVITSTDGGRTFSEPHLAETSTFPGGLASKLINKVAYWPRLAADASQGPHRGQIYLAYENYSNSRTSIAVVRSKDAQTWSEPVQVNDDLTVADDNTPGIAVSDNGVIGLSWYDRRSEPQGDCYQEFFSASTDGGVTFLPNVAVHAPVTCTLRPGNGQPNVSQSLDATRGTYHVVLSSPGPRFMNGGETQGIVALTQGLFRLAWISGDSGVMQLVSTAVDVTEPPLGADVGDLLTVTTDRPTLDAKLHTMSMQVTVTNNSRERIKAPLTLVLNRCKSVFDGLRVMNSDNNLVGVGAQWHLAKAAAGNDSLSPGQATQPVTLKFGFKKAAIDTWSESSLDVQFHIFERP